MVAGNKKSYSWLVILRCRRKEVSHLFSVTAELHTCYYKIPALKTFEFSVTSLQVTYCLVLCIVA